MQTSIMPLRQQNVVYFYDLPKDEYTSVKLATLIKSKSGVEVQQPQVRRDLQKPFYSAVIRIDDTNQFERVKQDFRYFDFEGKTCRALPYSADFAGVNLPKLVSQNLFIRKISKDKNSQDLENHFKHFGGIISCKVSLDEKHASRGYGFVCFQDSEYAAEALVKTKDLESFISVKFSPKDKTDQRKVFNNIFLKNLPLDVTKEEIEQLCAPYGHISSIHISQSKNPKDNSMQSFGFVCFAATDKNDIESGPRNAASAVQGLNDLEYKGKKLYVTEALKKQERAKVLEHETLKYKTSKKRCNLYVKGFENETEQDLRQIFGQFGEIESCRVFEAKEGKPHPHAFVCFKTPDQAHEAKNRTNLTLNGRQLYVNHYEIKQYRDLKTEDSKDKQDFQRHLHDNGNTGVDVKNIDQITNVIKQLMMSMRGQQAINLAQNGGQNQGGQRPYNNYNNNNQGAPQHYNKEQRPRGDYQNQGSRGGFSSQRGGHQNYAQPMPQASRPQPVISNNMPMPFAPQQQNFQSSHPMAAAFMNKTVPMLGAVNEMNPAYKQVTGSAIFEFVQSIVGDQAPKVTGMLIDLPVVEIQKYMVNFDLFCSRVEQAFQLLQQQAVAAGQN